MHALMLSREFGIFPTLWLVHLVHLASCTRGILARQPNVGRCQSDDPAAVNPRTPFDRERDEGIRGCSASSCVAFSIYPGRKRKPIAFSSLPAADPTLALSKLVELRFPLAGCHVAACPRDPYPSLTPAQRAPLLEPQWLGNERCIIAWGVGSWAEDADATCAMGGLSWPLGWAEDWGVRGWTPIPIFWDGGANRDVVLAHRRKWATPGETVQGLCCQDNPRCEPVGPPVSPAEAWNRISGTVRRAQEQCDGRSLSFFPVAPSLPGGQSHTRDCGL